MIMSKIEKLLEKLKNETISASEVRTLLKKLGWALRNKVGSHEHWSLNDKRITIATHGKEIPFYQIRQIKKELEN